ncbi:LysR family transcriptional regulator [Henriciella mobilis]|uniref:LysR family transcriptional regulator n=1 Tax=Henriciella mobilis TaxID=2305467 RepID=A0A399RRP1_9PROT|nr:LysR family transcriptional regulator [Henriciella mobilis]RIJ33003.1 LysR family transcriptional regulator [Henriciella mobilis]
MTIIKTGLLYFDKAIKDGSIRKAAENLNIASSAVNRQLLQLEEELGVELFERLPRGIRPTAAGEALLNYVRQWNRDASQLRHEIGRLKGGVRGTIRIAAAESITVDILPRAMTRLQSRFPLIDFTLISGDNYSIKSALLAKDADVVCAFDVSGGSRTETIFSGQSKVGVITQPGHPLAKLDEVTLSDCVPYPIIAPTEEWLNHSIIRELIQETDAPLQIAARVERIGMLKNLVQAGLGVAFISRTGFEDELTQGKLAWTPFADGVIRPTTISLLAPKGRVLMPYIRSFIDLMKEELEAHAASGL